MSDFDSRITPARPDLAAAHLKGQVDAARFVEPVEHQVVDPVAPIRRAPDPLSAMETQLLFGEGFAVLEERDGWAWGFSRLDGYVGWVDASGLSDVPVETNAHVAVLRTYAFVEPDFKTAPTALISLNARLETGARDGRFVEVTDLGWVFGGHVAALDETAADFVAVAEAFLGAPYLWGGKESLGLDCSGLTQAALQAAGIAVPRDTDMQEAHLQSIWDDVTAEAQRARGDIVFWPGHVGILTDSEHLLHANAHTMDVTLEPFEDAVARIAAAEHPVRTIVRPPAS